MTLRIVFVGASRFGLRCLEEVERTPGCRVVGLITATRHFRISYRPQGVTNVLHADFKTHARAHGIPYVTMFERMSDPAIVAAARGWCPDLFVVVGWYHLVPRVLREIAPAVGMHASLLPDYSGGAPLVWAMINGERKTGITLFELADGVDDGPILAQVEEVITDEDTIATLYARIEERGLELLRYQLPKLAAGDFAKRPQDHSRRRVFPQRSPEDGRIDWTWPARRVYDFVRAQTKPYPGAYTLLRGSRITVWAVSQSFNPAPSGGAAPGRFVERHRTPFVTCGDHRMVAILEASMDGHELDGEALCRLVGHSYSDPVHLG